MARVLRHHAAARGLAAPVAVVPTERPTEHTLPEGHSLAVDAVVPVDEPVVRGPDREDRLTGIQVAVDARQLLLRERQQARVEDHRVRSLEVLEPGDVMNDLLVLPLDLRGGVHAALLVLCEQHGGVHAVPLGEHLGQHRRALLAAVLLVAHDEHHVGRVLPAILGGVGEPARVLGHRVRPRRGDLVHRVVGVSVEQGIAGRGAERHESNSWTCPFLSVSSTTRAESPSAETVTERTSGTVRSTSGPP